MKFVHNRAKFGIHLKNGLRVTALLTASIRMFAILLYTGKLADKHSRFSVNSRYTISISVKYGRKRNMQRVDFWDFSLKKNCFFDKIE